MRKLNRKGFTLIELLAIIVILAIIMVVTIPTVLGSLGDARQKTFQASANTVAEWFEKQYSIVVVNDDTLVGGASSVFTTLCGNNGTSCSTSAKPLNATYLNAAGVKGSNYSSGTVQIINGRACVILKASDNGDFASLNTKNADNQTVYAEAKSSGCSS